jgi:hypothetical protein
MIEQILKGKVILAIIIRKSYQKDGIEFFSSENDSQQLGYMNRPKGYVIKPHKHKIVKREVHLTQEVLFIKRGSVRVDFYSDDQVYYKSSILNEGDVILLSNGGHGFKMLEKTEIIEVKQGPYIGELDKVRFDPIKEDCIFF